MDTADKLNRYSEYLAAADVLRLRKQEMIDAVLTPEIKARLDEIEAEFAPAYQAAEDNIAALAAEIKADVIQAGATVKGEHASAVYSRGRVSWDTKALDGYAAAHPEIAPFRKEGEPSVSIRMNK